MQAAPPADDREPLISPPVTWQNAGSASSETQPVDAPRLHCGCKSCERAFVDKEIETLANNAATKDERRLTFGYKEILYRCVIPLSQSFICQCGMQAVMVVMGYCTGAWAERMRMDSAVIAVFTICFLSCEYRILQKSIIPFVQEVNKFKLVGISLSFPLWLTLVMGMSAANQWFLGRVAFIVGKAIGGDPGNSGISSTWAKVVSGDRFLSWSTWICNESTFAKFIIVVVLLKSAIGIMLYYPAFMEVKGKNQHLHCGQVPSGSLASDDALNAGRVLHQEISTWTFKSLWGHVLRPAESLQQVVEAIGMPAAMCLALDYRFARVRANQDRQDLQTQNKWDKAELEWHICMYDFRTVVNIMIWRIVARGLVNVPKMLLMTAQLAAYPSDMGSFAVVFLSVTNFGPVVWGAFQTAQVSRLLKRLQAQHQQAARDATATPPQAADTKFQFLFLAKSHPDDPGNTFYLNLMCFWTACVLLVVGIYITVNGYLNAF